MAIPESSLVLIMADTAISITLVAGGITFVNQWYQTKVIDWKVPVGTVILAAGIGVIEGIDSKAAIMLSIMVLLGAATTQFNGKSILDVVTALTQSTTKNQTGPNAPANAKKNTVS